MNSELISHKLCADVLLKLKQPKAMCCSGQVSVLLLVTEVFEARVHKPSDFDLQNVAQTSQTSNQSTIFIRLYLSYQKYAMVKHLKMLCTSTILT